VVRLIFGSYTRHRLGARAHGTRVYRYYSCYRRSRYDTAACGGQRIDAHAIEAAVTSALVGFYRT
jgi:hypothetical protein